FNWPLNCQGKKIIILIHSSFSAILVGLSGSCVLIPCRFSYPENGKTYTEFKGIWLKGNEESTVFHTDASNIIDSFKGRTSLNGDLGKKDCSLKISSLSSSDAGSFIFRTEIKDLDNIMEKMMEKTLDILSTICVSSPETPENPNVSVEEEVTSGKPVTATCAVSHSCPSDLPKVTWSHDGKQSSPSQPQNHGQWKLTSYSLTFTPSREDHNKHLSCTAEFKGKTLTDYKTLKVKCKSPPLSNTIVIYSISVIIMIKMFVFKILSFKTVITTIHFVISDVQELYFFFQNNTI
uniref:Si:dkey-238d18.5 n=1 Tax=Cyprinus carpio TaxID=7962 RepID=A0A8C1GB28_CYPCA